MSLRVSTFLYEYGMFKPSPVYLELMIDVRPLSMDWVA